MIHITMNPEVAEGWSFFGFEGFFLKIQDDSEKNVECFPSSMY